MLKYIVKRSVQTIVALLAVSMLVFMLTNLIGNPIDMLVPGDATMEQVESARVRLGPDRPLPMQYAVFLKDILRGDFGKSHTYGKPAMGPTLGYIPVTMELVIIAAPLVLVVVIPLGVYTGAYLERASNKTIMSSPILGISPPSFWVSMMMTYIFAIILGKLPASGGGDTVDMLGVNLSIFAPDGIRFIILPAITLVIINVATILRLTRSGILENTRQGHIKFARVKGVSSRTLLFGHALENTLIPVAIIFGMDLGSMTAFTTITETIPAWPDMGKLFIDAINKSNKPIVVAYLMAAACMSVVLNSVADLLCTLIDSRIELR